jgi:hypothetical protein
MKREMRSEVYQNFQQRQLFYTVKKATNIPVPGRDVTNQTLPGREQLNYSRPGRAWFVTSQLGMGKSVTIFYSVPAFRLLCIRAQGTPKEIIHRDVRGASKVKLKKVNKKRTVTVRRVIIFLNISRHPLLICIQCCLHQYKTLKAVATVTAAIVLMTPAKNLKKVFLGFLVVSPLFDHFLG